MAEHAHSRKQQTQRRRHNLGLEKISPKRLTRIEGQNERKKKGFSGDRLGKRINESEKKSVRTKKAIGFSN